MKIAQWLDGGEMDLEDCADTDAILDRAGRMLDKSYVFDGLGSVLFKGEDGKLYTATIECVIDEADPGWAEQILIEKDLCSKCYGPLGASDSDDGGLCRKCSKEVVVVGD